MKLVLVAVATGLVGATVAGGQTESTTARCAKWAVPARVAGKAVCLRDNQTCRAKLTAQYRRYGFNCVYGRLVTRWSYLRARPLVEQQIDTGAPCPVTTETGRVGSYMGLGRGPAYPFGTHSAITMRLPPPEGWGSEWSGAKRVWLVDRRYTGRILVRGQQLDGPNEVRFVNGRPAFTAEKLLRPVRELRFEWGGDYPSLTRLRVPGCYAYQVDGRTFSYLVVFEARLE